jgi:type II secretory pathway pseudopilin PulG
MKNSRAGFSILELAIVLTVIALIVSSSLAVAASRIGAAKVESTIDKGADLMDMIDAYVTQYKRLPCPANPHAKPSDDDFGIGSDDLAGNCTAANIIISGNAAIGAVPTATLRLSPSSGTDGWNRRFTYAVDQRLSSSVNYFGVAANPTAIPPVACFAAINNGSLVINNAAPSGALISNQAAFVLISHGSNGHGAWSAKAKTASDVLIPRLQADETPSDHELANADDDATFVQQLGSPTFDDFVQYREAWQFPQAGTRITACP